MHISSGLTPHRALMDELFEEMKGRIKEDDSSVPIRDGDYLYWWAFRPGTQYRTWYRKPVAGGEDEVIFDEPVEAEGKDYFRLGALEVSPDGRLLATLVDENGSERFALRVRDLATGKDLETVTEVGIGQPVWTSDSGGIVFTEVNDNWRSYRARFHRLGSPLTDDVTLYEESEELGFSVGVSKSTDKSLILVSTGDNATSEVRFVSADDPTRPLTLISRRKPNRQYDVDAAHGKLWIVTNDEHVNFRLAEADPAAPGEWRTVIPGSDRVYLRGASAYRDHLALTTRVDGLDQLILRTYAGKETRIPFAEASYSAAFFGNPEFAPDAYRLGYSSMVTPATVYDYHPATGALETLKVQEIPSGYDASQYATPSRGWSPARQRPGAGLGRLSQGLREDHEATLSSTARGLRPRDEVVRGVGPSADGGSAGDREHVGGATLWKPAARSAFNASGSGQNGIRASSPPPFEQDLPAHAARSATAGMPIAAQITRRVTRRRPDTSPTRYRGVGERTPEGRWYVEVSLGLDVSYAARDLQTTFRVARCRDPAGRVLYGLRRRARLRHPSADLHPDADQHHVVRVGHGEPEALDLGAGGRSRKPGGPRVLDPA